MDDSILAGRFVDRINACLPDLQRELDEHEQLGVVEFLPLGKTVIVESVGYENPALVMPHNVEHDNGWDGTLLTHRSELQILVAADKITLG